MKLARIRGAPPLLIGGALLFGIALWFSQRENVPDVPIPSINGDVSFHTENTPLTANSTYERDGKIIHYIDEPTTLERLWTTNNHHILVGVIDKFNIEGSIHPYDLLLGKDHFQSCEENQKRVNDFWFYVYKKNRSESTTGFEKSRFGISPCAAWKNMFPAYPSKIEDMIQIEEGDLLYIALSPEEHDKFTERNEEARIGYQSEENDAPECSDGIDNDGDGGIDVPGDFVATPLEGLEIEGADQCDNVYFGLCKGDFYIGNSVVRTGNKLFEVSNRSIFKRFVGLQNGLWIFAFDFATGQVASPWKIPNDLEGEGMTAGDGGTYFPDAVVVDHERDILYIPYSLGADFAPETEGHIPPIARIHKVDVSGATPVFQGRYVADTNEWSIASNLGKRSDSIYHHVYDKRMALSTDGNFLYIFLKKHRIGKEIKFVKIDTRTMTEVDSVDIGDNGISDSAFFHIDVQSQVAFVTHRNKLSKIDLESFTVAKTTEVSLVRDVPHIIGYLPRSNVLFLTTEGKGAAYNYSALVLVDAVTLQKKGEHILGNGTRQGEFDVFTPSAYVDPVRERAFVTVTPSNSSRTGEPFRLFYNLSSGTLDEMPQEEAMPDGYTFMLPEYNKGVLLTDTVLGLVDPETHAIITQKTFAELIGSPQAEFLFFEGKYPVVLPFRSLFSRAFYKPPYLINLGDPQCVSAGGSE